MKKTFLKTLALSVLCVVVLAISAFAAEDLTANADGTFDVSYAGTDGEYYALVVVSGTYEAGETPTISDQTVFYIDQATATSEGVSFNFTPNSDAAATAYIGGSDLTDGPVIVGYLNAEPEVVYYNVSVAVTADSDAAATVKLTAGETEVTATYDEATSKYVASVPAGTYTLTVNVPKHLSYTMNALAVAADVEKAVTLKGGDVNASGTIDEVDLGNILTDFASTESEYDITGEGTVDEVDLGIVLTNFSSTAVVE